MSPVQSPKSKQEKWMWEIAAGDGRELDPDYKLPPVPIYGELEHPLDEDEKSINQIEP